MGDVTVTGNASLTNNCRIDGTLWVGGTVKADSSPHIGGNLQSGGQVTIQSTVRISGYLATAAGLTVLDGKSVANLKTIGTVHGEIYTAASTLPLPAVAAPAVPTPETTGAETSWGAWLKSIAVGAGAPSWSAALQTKPGCVLSTSTVGTAKLTVTGNTVVDATGAACPTVTLQGLAIDLKADLTLKVNALGSTNGLKVTASDGRPHKLTIVAGSGSGSLIRLVGPTSIDPQVTANLTSSGTVQIDGSTDLTGTIRASRLVTSGAVTVHATGGA
ncbi:hypothetical protein [Cellulomonas sp. URHE0023]|uniref:hypothetical protein n=1 Tax=Cellulomonas sp. URHE0023 TaxID=1380354 RepID=UPI0012DEBB5B|nr:hypothetical protein [Cellulomonas sp. URHE0023]